MNRSKLQRRGHGDISNRTARILRSALEDRQLLSYYSVSTTPTPTTAPNGPYALTAAPLSSSQILLNWHDNSNNESGFAVQRRVGTSGPWTIIPLAANSTTDTGLLSGTTYNYRVRAFNGLGDSSFTDIVAGTTP